MRLIGTLREAQIRDGVARGPTGLRQRRVRASVFGEPDDHELVPASVHPARPHRLAYEAWQRMFAAGLEAGLPEEHLVIHSAYRSVVLQAEIWAYRLEERRMARQAQGLAPLPQRELERQQMKWTARPGTSAHHTGLALDLGLYHLARRPAPSNAGPSRKAPDPIRAAKATPTYAWLAVHARDFGFYPYLPEPWHWEFNPPGLIATLRALRGIVT